MAERPEPPALDLGWASHTGHLRQENQDRCQARPLGPGALLVLADGMGAPGGGGVAAEVALHTAVTGVTPEVFALGEEDSLGALTRVFGRAHRAVQRRARQRPELARMGTTLVVALVEPRRLRYLHAGDSRVYLLRDGQVMHRSGDHTVVEALLSLGKITPEEAQDHPMRHKLTSCLGSMEWDQVHLSPDPEEPPARGLRPADVVLLCSDGVHGALSDRELGALACAPGTAQQRAEALVARVLVGEATDNASAVLAVVPEAGAR